MEEELLIIVGRIKYNGATCDVRILFDSEIAGDIVIQNGETKYETSVSSTESNLFTLENLAPEVKYEMTALFNGKTYDFNFSTTQSPKVAFVSCCGYYSSTRFGKLETDSSTLEKLASDDYEVMVHLGDQVYSDYIRSDNIDSETVVDYDAEYRKMYRKVFGSSAMQDILRKGSHIMICHDHEFAEEPENGFMDITKDYNIAAKKLYLEYQTSLWSDTEEICKTIEYENNNLIILNIYYDWLYNFDKEAPLISNNLQTLTLNAMREDLKNIIILGVPMFKDKYCGWSTDCTDSLRTQNYPSHSTNIDHCSKFIDNLMEYKDSIFIGGDSHIHEKSYITSLTRGTVATQYVSSGLNIYQTKVFLQSNFLKSLVHLTFPARIAMGNTYSHNRRIHLDTNYIILQSDNSVKIYKGNNFPFSNFVFFYFHSLLVLTLFVLWLIQNRKILYLPYI